MVERRGEGQDILGVGNNISLGLGVSYGEVRVQIQLCFIFGIYRKGNEGRGKLGNGVGLGRVLWVTRVRVVFFLGRMVKSSDNSNNNFLFLFSFRCVLGILNQFLDDDRKDFMRLRYQFLQGFTWIFVGLVVCRYRFRSLRVNLRIVQSFTDVRGFWVVEDCVVVERFCGLGRRWQLIRFGVWFWGFCFDDFFFGEGRLFCMVERLRCSTKLGFMLK